MQLCALKEVKSNCSDGPSTEKDTVICRQEDSHSVNKLFIDDRISTESFCLFQLGGHRRG